MTHVKIRMPAVAGSFYPLTAEAIRRQIGSFVEKNNRKDDAIAALLPHAGYAYSGKVAAQTVSGINIKDTVILLGPNHSGLGPAFSVATEGAWQTPLGEVDIDTELAGLLLDTCRHFQEDALAHLHEHSLEVELPILQYFKAGFKIVPLAVASTKFDPLCECGNKIAETLINNKRTGNVMLIASSDLTHYESQDKARQKDKIAIEAILGLDEKSLFDNVKKYNISMCGYAPSIIMVTAAKRLGAQRARLVGYSTSGDVTGDKTSVVGYAGIVLY